MQRITCKLSVSIKKNNIKIYFYLFCFCFKVAPKIKLNKNSFYANNNDQLEIICDIESKPESIFVWYVIVKCFIYLHVDV